MKTHEKAFIIAVACFIGLLASLAAAEVDLDQCKLELVRAETLLEVVNNER